MKIDQLQTPCYVIDEKKMRENLEILKKVQEDTGCKILLAQKAFSGFALYPMIGKYLAGTTASGLFEARLGYEEMGKENHVFSPAYRTEDIEELDHICDHIIFNSTAQLKKFKEVCTGASLGLRINPECSTQGDHAIYDPCAPGSRLGVTRENFDGECLKWIDGLHFHTLCEQNADDLEKTLQAVEEKFGEFLSEVSWLNMGGGHHITREDYDVKLLEKCIQHMKETYDLDIYLEPGEAVALNAGYLVTEVMDIVENEIRTLILDASAACHMPDVLEMKFAALVVVGDGKGTIGYGIGKSGEVPEAIRKGEAAAKKNMHKVALKGTTIPHEIVGKYGAGAVLLKPAAPGTGMIAGGPVRAVIEAAGIKDVRAKSMRSNNPINVVSATFAGLCGLVSAESVAEKRGKTVKEILG